MDATKRKALEAAGWKVGDAADFLEMSDEERQLLDTRVENHDTHQSADENHQVTLPRTAAAAVSPPKSASGGATDRE